ncbi:MAG: MFS transporter [Lentisphaerales bacterium]|nr:MFS transporter [Lentisphaerales bacterium]
MKELHKQVHSWRIKIFCITWLAYFGFYLTRKAFSAAKNNLDVDVDETTLGMIDSAYLIAYALGQFVLGATADKKGPRFVLLAGMLGSIICAALMGVFGMPLMFMVLMFIQGLCQSSGWAPLNKNVGNWFTRRERGRIMGFWCTNYAAGGAVASTLAAAGITWSGGDWRFAFFVPAACLLVVWFLVYKFQKNKPQDLGFPSMEEIKGEPVDEDDEEEKFSWQEIIKKPMVGLLGAAYFLLKPARYAILFWGPYYVAKKLQTGPVFSTVISNSFEIAGILGAILGGYISDKFFKAKRMPVCILCLAALTLVLFSFDRLVTHTNKQVSSDEIQSIHREVRALSRRSAEWVPARENLQQLVQSGEPTAERLALVLRSISEIGAASTKETIQIEGLKVRLSKILRSTRLNNAESADSYKVRLQPLLEEVRVFEESNAVRLQLESLARLKKFESSQAIKKIFLLIQQTDMLHQEHIRVLTEMQQELLESMEDRGDNMSFFYLMKLEAAASHFSASEKEKIVAFLTKHKDFTSPQSKIVFDDLSQEIAELKPLQKEIDRFLLIRSHAPAESLNISHYVMIISLFLIGLFLYAPDSVISSMAAVDFGGHKGASSAAGFVNGCGSISSIFSGIGVGYIAQNYSWGVLFNIFGSMTLLATLILIPKWNAVPSEHQSNRKTKES